MNKAKKRKFKPAYCFAILVIVGAVLFAAKHFFTQPKIKNVVLISIDTCRADRLGCYGFDKGTTPNIDSIAAEGVLFEHVITPVPYTLPAHCSMLTGTDPVTHGAHSNFNSKLNQESITLAEILRGNGFKTAGVVSSFVLDTQFGIAQGFDAYYDKFNDEGKKEKTYSDRSGDKTTDIAVELLDEYKDDPFFLFMHLYDPHYPYLPPEPFATKFADDMYSGEVAFVDHCIGRVVTKLKKLGQYDNTLLVVTADHGESLGDHGESLHGYYIYQSTISVPLIFKVPGLDNSKRDDYAGIIDIVPTVIGALGLDVEIDFAGKDLEIFSDLKKLKSEPRNLYCESVEPLRYKCSSLLGLISPPWKYIQTTNPELYNLSTDPHELNNLLMNESKRARVMKDELELIITEKSDVHSATNSALDAQSIAKLESLGYLGGASTEGVFDFSSGLNDAKDFIKFHERSSVAKGLIIEGHLDSAKTTCKDLLKDYPDLSYPNLLLGDIAYGQKKLQEASEYYLKTISLDDKSHKAYARLGDIFNLEGKLGEAVEYWGKSLDVGPASRELNEKLGTAYHHTGKPDIAIKYYKAAIELESDSKVLYSRLAEAYLLNKQIDKAVFEWEQALKLDPDDSSVLNNVAWLRATIKTAGVYDPAKAVSYSKKACSLTNNQKADYLDTLSTAYAAMGEYKEAIEAAQKAIAVYKVQGNDVGVSEMQTKIKEYQ